MTAPHNQQIEELATLVSAANRVMVFSGAGISTASGIPDFRGPNGVWSRFKPSDFHIDKLMKSEESRRQYWRRSTEMYACIREARPNNAHVAIANLHTTTGKLWNVITQNIDELHQQAGLPAEKVIELHGSSHRIACMCCEKEVPRSQYQPLVSVDGDAPPCTHCNGLMKPATISFGQALTPGVMQQAREAAETSDLCVVVGSSLVVQPAAMIPLWALEAGANLAIINLEPTPYDKLAQLVIHDKADSVLRTALQTKNDTIAKHGN